MSAGYAEGGIVDGPALAVLPIGASVWRNARALALPAGVEFTIPLADLDPALLAVLFGHPDPDVDRATIDAWHTDGGAIGSDR